MDKDLEKLLDSCEVDTFRSSGKGGQHVNKTDSAVRLRHLPTGLVVVSRDERSQYLNKVRGLENLQSKIEKRNKKPTPRIPTKVSKSARRKRVDTKKKEGEKKLSRKKPGLHEE